MKQNKKEEHLITIPVVTKKNVLNDFIELTKPMEQ